MKILCNTYSGKAWLLSRNGKEIRVLNHPSESFEFESVVDVVAEYGSDYEKRIADRYLQNPSDELKRHVLDIYNNNWCKVRVWGTFSDEVYFRITSTAFNWYVPITGFLMKHPEFERSFITVEADRSSGSKRLYWSAQPYKYVVDPNNEVILAAKLIR